MRLVGYESAPSAALAPAKSPASSLRSILKKPKPVLGSATASLPTLTSTAQPSGARVSTESLPKKRRRSEAEMLLEWEMRPKAYYRNQPTLPKFQTYKRDYRSFDPYKGEQTEDNKTKDPDYNPEQER